MHVSEQGRQQVCPRDFWIAVLLVTALLGGMGASLMQTGHVPSLPTWVGAAFPLFVWVAVLAQTLRHGRLAWTPIRVAFLLGYTLFIGIDLVPHLGRLTWLENVGVVLMIPCVLAQWVGFGKRPRTVPPDDAPPRLAP